MKRRTPLTGLTTSGSECSHNIPPIVHVIGACKARSLLLCPPRRGKESRSINAEIFMKMRSIAPFAMVAVLALASLVGFVGCELDSADSFTREVEGRVDFSGFYTGDEGHLIRPANSGLRVTSLNLFQSGDQLEAICNNRHRYKGSLHEVRDKASGFTMIGRTSAGKDVTLTGTLTADGTSGKMRGTWIESDRYCQVYGIATGLAP